MIQVDLPLSYTVGSALALAAQGTLRNEPSLCSNRPLASTLVYLGLIHVPACLAYLTHWTDWDTMYWWTRETLPVWVAPTFALGLFLFGWLGFVATHALVRKGRTGPAVALCAAGVLLTAVVCAIWRDRFLFVGTQADFLRGPTINLHKSDVLIGLTVLNGLVMGIPMLILGVRFWKSSRPAP